MTKHKQINISDLYEDVEKIKDSFAEAGQDVRDKAGEIFAESIVNFKDQSAAVKDTMTEYVTKKPFKSIVVTLLAGISIGYLLRK